MLLPKTDADRRHRGALLTAIRETKESLSRRTTTALTIPSLDHDSHLTRDELDAIAGPMLERTVAVTRETRVLRDADLDISQVTGVFLVGAASRMPLVATMLHRELGIAPTAVEQPELAVSEGALASAPSEQPEPHSNATASSAGAQTNARPQGHVDQAPLDPATDTAAVLPPHRPIPPLGRVRPVLWLTLAAFMVPALFCMFAFDESQYWYWTLPLALVVLPIAAVIALLTQSPYAVGAYGLLLIATCVLAAMVDQEELVSSPRCRSHWRQLGYSVCGGVPRCGCAPLWRRCSSSA